MRFWVAVAAVGSLALLGVLDLLAGDYRVGMALLFLSAANAEFLL